MADPPNQVLVVGLVALLTLAAFYASAATSGRKSAVLAVLVVAIPALFLVTQALGGSDGGRASAVAGVQAEDALRALSSALGPVGSGLARLFALAPLVSGDEHVVVAVPFALDVR